MKTKHYTLLTCLLLIITLAILCPCRNKVAEASPPPSESIRNTDLAINDASATLGQDAHTPQQSMEETEIAEVEGVISEEELYVKIGHEIARFSKISEAFIIDYRHYLVNKYEGLTEEQRSARVKELEEARKSRPPPSKEEEEVLRFLESEQHLASIFHSSYPLIRHIEEEELRLLESERVMARRFHFPPPLRRIDDSNVDAFIEERNVFIRATGARNMIGMYINRDQLARFGDKGLLIVPSELVDFRDGEIRLPPSTGEFWKRFSAILDLVYRSNLTDDDIAKIRQLSSEIKDMAKTNTPTSAFQMPTAEPR